MFSLDVRKIFSMCSKRFRACGGEWVESIPGDSSALSTLISQTSPNMSFWSPSSDTAMSVRTGGSTPKLRILKWDWSVTGDSVRIFWLLEDRYKIWKVEVQVIKMASRAIFDSIDLVKWGRRLILLKQSASGQSMQFKKIRLLYGIIFVKILSNVLIRLKNTIYELKIISTNIISLSLLFEFWRVTLFYHFFFKYPTSDYKYLVSEVEYFTKKKKNFSIRFYTLKSNRWIHIFWISI